MFVIKHRKIFFTISGLLVLFSLVVIFTKGLNIGIDFTGGSAVEVRYSENRPEVSVVRQILKEKGIETASIRPFGDNGFMFQLKSTDSVVHDVILTSLTQANPEAQIEMAEPHIIGPSVGKELRSKAWIAIVIVSLGIILFVALAFRHASEKVSSWKYGTIAVVALMHDIIIPTGLVAFLGMEISSLFIIALLAILGLSVNDTIVVFDRVRENIKFKISRDFSELVGKSLEQTFVRSVNTSLTTIFVLLSLYFIGPESTKDFAFVLTIGLIVGTYSSIFIASPLLVEVEKRDQSQKKKK